MRRILEIKWVVTGLMVAMLLVLMVCLFRPDQIMLLRRIAGYSLHLIFLYLAAAIGFLIYGKRNLMLISLACCATLCMVLKSKSNASIQAISTTSEPTMHLVQTSMSVIATNWDISYEALLATDADAIAFLEVTPRWGDVLHDYFGDAYPHKVEMVRIDDQGVAVYSKNALTILDTLMTAGLHSLVVGSSMGVSDSVVLILTNAEPPLFEESFNNLNSQLTTIGNYATEVKDVPLLALGNYHLDQFSDELQDFRALAGLKDSRKTMTPSFTPPTNHIFHNQRLEFQHFSNVYDENSRRVGIQGIYQVKVEVEE